MSSYITYCIFINIQLKYICLYLLIPNKKHTSARVQNIDSLGLDQQF